MGSRLRASLPRSFSFEARDRAGVQYTLARYTILGHTAPGRTFSRPRRCRGARVASLRAHCGPPSPSRVLSQRPQCARVHTGLVGLRARGSGPSRFACRTRTAWTCRHTLAGLSCEQRYRSAMILQSPARRRQILRSEGSRASSTREARDFRRAMGRHSDPPAARGRTSRTPFLLERTVEHEPRPAPTAADQSATAAPTWPCTSHRTAPHRTAPARSSSGYRRSVPGARGLCLARPCIRRVSGRLPSALPSPASTYEASGRAMSGQYRCSMPDHQPPYTPRRHMKSAAVTRHTRRVDGRLLERSHRPRRPR
ncbi:hypothetical protein BD413DRAFT_189912 [Trametes elegans]|nr:hypothetical protein BD413DRAFT_189912 [Trametes elegans]